MLPTSVILMAMSAQLPSKISSFVIRFVVEPGENWQHSDYRGAIRHIQTDEEFVFSDWEEAVMFIQNYVPLKKQNK